MKIIKSIILSLALSLTAFAQSSFFHHAAVFTSASGSAYTSGDSVGTVQTLTNIAVSGRSITLDAFTLKDSANQKKAGYLLFFDASAPTLVDNDAFAFGSSLGNLIAIVDVGAADYVTFDSKGIVTRTFVGTRLKLAAPVAGSVTGNLYVAFVTTDTPTYGNGGTLTFDFHFSN